MSHHYSGPQFGFPRGDARLDLTDVVARLQQVGRKAMTERVTSDALADPRPPRRAVNRAVHRCRMKVPARPVAALVTPKDAGREDELPRKLVAGARATASPPGAQNRHCVGQICCALKDCLA